MKRSRRFAPRWMTTIGPNFARETRRLRSASSRAAGAPGCAFLIVRAIASVIVRAPDGAAPLRAADLRAPVVEPEELRVLGRPAEALLERLGRSSDLAPGRPRPAPRCCRRSVPEGLRDGIRRRDGEAEAGGRNAPTPTAHAKAQRNGEPRDTCCRACSASRPPMLTPATLTPLGIVRFGARPTARARRRRTGRARARAQRASRAPCGRESGSPLHNRMLRPKSGRCEENWIGTERPCDVQGRSVLTAAGSASARGFAPCRGPWCVVDGCFRCSSSTSCAASTTYAMPDERGRPGHPAVRLPVPWPDSLRPGPGASVSRSWPGRRARASCWEKQPVRWPGLSDALPIRRVRDVGKSLREIDHLLRELVDVTHLSNPFLVALGPGFPGGGAPKPPNPGWLRGPGGVRCLPAAVVASQWRKR